MSGTRLSRPIFCGDPTAAAHDRNVVFRAGNVVQTEANDIQFNGLIWEEFDSHFFKYINVKQMALCAMSIRGNGTRASYL